MSNTFYELIEVTVCYFFPLLSVNVVCYCDQFSYVEAFLHSRNKSCLVMTSNSFNMLLNLVFYWVYLKLPAKNNTESVQKLAPDIMESGEIIGGLQNDKRDSSVSILESVNQPVWKHFSAFNLGSGSQLGATLFPMQSRPLAMQGRGFGCHSWG